MFRALRGLGVAGVDGGGVRSFRQRARRGAFGLVLLLVVAIVIRAVLSLRQSGAGHPDAAYATRVYRSMFPASSKGASPEMSRANAFSAAYGRAGTGGRHTPYRGAYRRPVILVIGDSLVQRGFERPDGWVGSLANEYARFADVVLRGYSGYNTRWIKELMLNEPELFPAADQVAVVVILLGANDSVRPEGRKAAYGVDVTEYAKNLRWIMDRYSGGTIKILCTPPPVDQEERLRITTDVRGMPASLLDRSSERAGGS